MNEPVLCPIAPELVNRLRQPGGMRTSVPVRAWLDQDNVITIQEIYDPAVVWNLLIRARDALDHSAHDRDETCYGCFLEAQIDEELTARRDGPGCADAS